MITLCIRLSSLLSWVWDSDSLLFDLPSLNEFTVGSNCFFNIIELMLSGIFLFLLFSGSSRASIIRHRTSIIQQHKESYYVKFDFIKIFNSIFPHFKSFLFQTILSSVLISLLCPVCLIIHWKLALPSLISFTVGANSFHDLTSFALQGILWM